MNFKTDDISINTFIGPGAVISGDIRDIGFVRIDGDIDGNFETAGNVIIGEKARIRGNVTAKNAIIGGAVLGNVKAIESLQLLSTSTIIGDIITKHLQLDEKVVLHGHCIALTDENIFEEKLSEYTDAKAVISRIVH